MSIRRLIAAARSPWVTELVWLRPHRPIPEPTSNSSMLSRRRACLLAPMRMQSGWVTRPAISFVEGTPRWTSSNTLKA